MESGHTVTSAPGFRGGALTSQENTPMLNRFDFITGYVRARFGDTEKGASLVEYALLVALIAVVCIAAITFIGTAGSEELDKVGSSIQGGDAPE